MCRPNSPTLNPCPNSLSPTHRHAMQTPIPEPVPSRHVQSCVQMRMDMLCVFVCARTCAWTCVWTCAWTCLRVWWQHVLFFDSSLRSMRRRHLTWLLSIMWPKLSSGYRSTVPTTTNASMSAVRRCSVTPSSSVPSRPSATRFNPCRTNNSVRN